MDGYKQTLISRFKKRDVPVDSTQNPTTHPPWYNSSSHLSWKAKKKPSSVCIRYWNGKKKDLIAGRIWIYDELPPSAEARRLLYSDRWCHWRARSINSLLATCRTIPFGLYFAAFIDYITHPRWLLKHDKQRALPMDHLHDPPYYPAWFDNEKKNLLFPLFDKRNATSWIERGRKKGSREREWGNLFNEEKILL